MPYDSTFEVVRSENAVDGSKIAKLTVGKNCRKASLGSDWIELEADKDYMFFTIDALCLLTQADKEAFASRKVKQYGQRIKTTSRPIPG